MADSGGSRSAASSSLRAPSMPPLLLCLPSSPLPCVVEVAMTSSTPDLASSSTGRHPRCGHRRRCHLLLLDAAWEEGRHRAPLGGAAVLGVGVGDGDGPELLLPRGGRVDDEELEVDASGGDGKRRGRDGGLRRWPGMTRRRRSSSARRHGGWACRARPPRM
uniref:Uncharacterized protein n=1 Tax=Oryza meridionalis TaxID=40149 RepID=A0A0E0DPH6_9ORYZ